MWRVAPTSARGRPNNVPRVFETALGSSEARAMMKALPDPVAELCAVLARIEGVEAVAIGGSRAAGTADAESDWDLGVYYRGNIDLASLVSYGDVHPPGSWGRIMNGGAWLSLDGLKVDALLGYLAGAPTYILMAELARNQTVHGRLPAIGEYPKPLSKAGADRWLLHAEF